MNLPYLIPRLVRHFLPERIVRALLLRNIIIRSGLETNDPSVAVQRYVDVLAGRGLSFRDKRVLVFGYGGRFDIGFALLKAGAEHILLCDKYAPPDESHNLQLFAAEEKYFLTANDVIRPRAEWMTLLEADIRGVKLDPVDIVLSSSVYEHVDDVEGITRVLSHNTKQDGINIHYVDLRDHFFKYPFEMLRFSEGVWHMWLNPSSNHNRYRLWNYREAFNACFKNVDMTILTHEEAAFRRLMPYIRPEFLSGDMNEDSAGIVRVIATNPIRG